MGTNLDCRTTSSVQASHPGVLGERQSSSYAHLMMTDVIETEYNSAQRAEDFARVRPANVAEGIAMVAEISVIHKTTAD